MEIIIIQTGKCHHPGSLLITKCHLFEGEKRRCTKSEIQKAKLLAVGESQTPILDFRKVCRPKQQNPLLRCAFPMSAMPFSLAFSVQDIIIYSNDRFNLKPNRLLTSTSVSQTQKQHTQKRKPTQCSCLLLLCACAQHSTDATQCSCLLLLCACVQHSNDLAATLSICTSL